MSTPPALHAVAIAGGSGTRFWPLSRTSRPKQLIDLSGEGTLLHSTFARIASLVPAERWWMVVGAAHADGCRAAVPEVAPARALVEPLARNTAPAIGLAAVHLRRVDPNALMVVLPADHHVTDAPAFCAALARAAQVAAAGAIVTLGIRPTHPETGYGYIQQGDPDPRGEGCLRVRRFAEKPDQATAAHFLADGSFVWNAGIFVMRAEAYLQEVRRQLPELARALDAISSAVGGPDEQAALAAAYGGIKGISIDYGVMEHAADVSVVPVTCGWSDVGSWSALGAVVPADADGNVVRGDAVLYQSRNCVAYAADGHVVALVGVESLVVVHTPDATLVVPADRAQDVRAVLATLEERAWQRFA